MAPLGMGQPAGWLSRRGRLLPSSSSSPPPSRRTKTAKTSPDYGHFARPWRIDPRLLAAELEADRFRVPTPQPTPRTSPRQRNRLCARTVIDHVSWFFRSRPDSTLTESLIDHFRRRQGGSKREGPTEGLDQPATTRIDRQFKVSTPVPGRPQPCIP